MSYKVKYQENGKVKTLSISENDYLENNLPENIIMIKRKIDLNNIFNSRKIISIKTLIEILSELNIMLDSNILFDDAFDILIKTNSNETKKEFLRRLKHSFINHLDIKKVLKDFTVDAFSLSLFSLIQSSGEPKRHIKTIYEILKEENEIKKQIKKALAYPLILIVSFIIALIGIFNFVVPKFETMFFNNDIPLSLATKSLFFVKGLFENYLVFILISLFVLVICSLLFYKRNEKLRYFIDKLIFKYLFVVSDIYRLRLMYRFFYILNSLLLSRYEFDETINKSKTLINNKYFLDKITRIDSSLKSGKSIYSSFKESDIFEELILNIIKTAEISNSIKNTSYEIKTIYKKRFKEKVEIFTILIEPLCFILIMLLIVWIIMAIFVPLWSIGDILKL